MKTIILFLNNNPRISKLLIPLGSVFLFIITCAVKINDWSIKYPRCGRVGYYLFFFITIPFKRFLKWHIRKILYYSIENAAKKDRGENEMLQNAAIYLRTVYEDNAWKFKVSKKWYDKILRREYSKVHGVFVANQSKISLPYFRTLIELFCRYNVIGYAPLSNTGTTTVKIE